MAKLPHRFSRMDDTPPGSDFPATTHYQFADARLDPQGDGFLGFGVRRTWVPARPAETTTWYGVGHELVIAAGQRPNASRPLRELTAVAIVTHDAKGVVGAPTQAVARLRETIYDRDVRWLGVAPHMRWLALDQGDITTEWDEPVTIDWAANASTHIGAIDANAPTFRTTSTTRTFDDFANTLSTATTTSPDGDASLLTRAFENRVDPWLVGLMTQELVAAAKVPGPLPDPRETTFEYDARGRLATKHVEPMSADPSVKQPPAAASASSWTPRPTRSAT